MFNWAGLSCQYRDPEPENERGHARPSAERPRVKRVSGDAVPVGGLSGRGLAVGAGKSGAQGRRGLEEETALVRL